MYSCSLFLFQHDTWLYRALTVSSAHQMRTKYHHAVTARGTCGAMLPLLRYGSTVVATVPPSPFIAARCARKSITL